MPLATKDGYGMAASGGLPLMLDGNTRQVMRTHMSQESTEVDNAQPWMEDGVVLAGSAGLLFLFSAKDSSTLKSQMTKYRQAQAAKVRSVRVARCRRLIRTCYYFVTADDRYAG